jgi:hypothetical protein
MYEIDNGSTSVWTDPLRPDAHASACYTQGGARLHHSPTLPCFPRPSMPTMPLPSMHGAPAAVASGSHCNILNIPGLLLKHPNETITTYVQKQLKHSKHAPETHAKTYEKYLKNNCKHMQHPYKILATYV